MHFFFLLSSAVVAMIGIVVVVSQDPHALASRMSDIRDRYQEVAPQSWQQSIGRIEGEGPYAQATGSTGLQPETAANFRESLGARFQQAGKQIEDPEINTYYETLMEGIEPAFTDPGRKGLANQLPDIEHIYHQSLTGPFQAAGVEIQSPETRSHYQRLTEAVGLVEEE